MNRVKLCQTATLANCGMATLMPMVTVTATADEGGATTNAETVQLWELACALAAHDMIPQAIASLEVPSLLVDSERCTS